MATRKKSLNYFLGKKYDGMMGRCYREKDISYVNYGARGIRVCSEWIKDVDSFRKWFIDELVKNKVELDQFLTRSKYYQLDRKDVNGHYTQENCRISSPQNNSRNKRILRGKTITSAEGEVYEF